MLARVLLPCALLLLPCDALIVGPAACRTTRVSPAARAAAPTLGFFDNLFKGPDAESLIGTVANPADFSVEELAALKAARCALPESAPPPPAIGA